MPLHTKAAKPLSTERSESRSLAYNESVARVAMHFQYYNAPQKVQYVLLLARSEAVEVRDHLIGFAAVCQDCLQQVIGAVAVQEKYLAFLRNNNSADIAQEHVVLPSKRSAYEVALCPEPDDG